MSPNAETLNNIVVANHILAHEEVVDAYGHISFRHPDDPEKYLLSRARAPELGAGPARAAEEGPELAEHAKD